MKKSLRLYKEAQAVIPGGVNSPVRAFKSVGGHPVFIKQGIGAYMFDVDGKRYIDYIGSWGPLILGHAHPSVITAVNEALHLGMSFGTPTELEIALAKKIIALMPSIEKIRMVNSGTEATMTAIRLARGFTKRPKLIKFRGCYHGHTDSLLANAGSGVLTLGLPSTPGIPDSITEHTLVAPFNDLTEVTRLCEHYPTDIAAMIVEPIAGNMGFVQPDAFFLQGLRTLCDHYKITLIFDEVMTGFRVALGGAQSLYAVRPDLTTLGKIIGGGLPVGAVGGKASLMSFLAPEGPVYQAGTLSGNPLAMAAGLATLKEVEKPGFYERLSFLSQSLICGLNTTAEKLNMPFWSDAVGGMFGFCFNDKKTIRNEGDVASSNETLFKSFFHGMLDQGIYFAPSMYEAGFMSYAHSEKDIQYTLDAAEAVLTKSVHFS